MKRVILGPLVAMVIAAGLGAGLEGSRAHLLFSPTPGGGGGGPIAFVAFGDLDQASGTTLTHAYSIHTGTDTGLFVCVETTSDTVTAVNMDGSLSATFLIKNAPGTFSRYASLWYFPLGNTTAGSHTFNIISSTSTTIFGSIGEYTKMQQSTTPDAAVGRSGPPDVTNDNVPITTTQAGDWFVSCANSDAGLVSGTNTTLRGTPACCTYAAGIFDSNATLSVGSNTMNIIAAGGSYLYSANVAMKTD